MITSLRSSRFLYFSRRRDRTSEQASGRAKKRAWGEQKIGEKWGGDEREGSLTCSFVPSARFFGNACYAGYMIINADLCL